MQKYSRVVVGALVLALAGCSSTGALTPQGRAAVSVACGIDAAVPGVVTVVGAVVAITDPTAAAAVVLANQSDRLLHPVVVDACGRALAGSVPVGVTVAGP